MADLLNSDGINYSVFLRVYSGLPESTDDIHTIVTRLIGHEAVLAGVRDVGVSEVVETLLQSLGYVGDEGAGPGPNVLRSPDFSRLLGNIRDNVVQLSQTVYGIKSFVFARGHPAYPVFWDFAYLFLGNHQHVLLLGSSSD
ncbi:hypothetical protein GJV26_00630 [Massilia dura]|uniref:Uncharacterized protein n=1 Tax=Pseudoduganella dura TaxID=321982 RepID=A0A6I3X2B3_9BURK|nr:hypothetical protein [Pseudoduganella dura]MUI11004.1 hypothetical protein [Pseudoduganella dura]